MKASTLKWQTVIVGTILPLLSFYHGYAYEVKWDARLYSEDKEYLEVIVDTEIDLSDVIFVVDMLDSENDPIDEIEFSFTDLEVSMLEGGHVHHRRFKHGVSNAYYAVPDSLVYREVTGGGKLDGVGKTKIKETEVDAFPIRVPRQITPVNGKYIRSALEPVVFTWSRVPGAEKYFLEVDCSTDGYNWNADETEPYRNRRSCYYNYHESTRFKIQWRQRYGQTHLRWRVLAVGDEGRSPFTEWWYFRYRN